MSDKELIKQEIERRIDLYSIAEKDDSTFARMGELSSLIDLINSLPEEHASEDLEEEIKNYIKDSLAIKFPTTDKEQIKADIRYIAHHFAEWQREQLMKDALNCSIIMHPNVRFANYSISAYVPPLHPASTYISNGDKVKIIIIKEEQQ